MPTPSQLATLAARLTTDPSLTPGPDSSPASLQAPRTQTRQDETDAEIAVRASAMVADVEQGMSIAKAGTKHGFSRMQAYRMISAWDDMNYDGAVRNLLKLKGVQAVEDWSMASAAAATRGNHTPAKELLTHAGIIEPVTGQEGTQRTNIAIVIGTPDAPVKVQSS